ncbi:MAG: hypothetical protein NTW86_04815 [Candidatus Sumerlaeota bacterium]|nr:hypothetical protein [Candidatus Sumerlaeota bacterium]
MIEAWPDSDFVFSRSTAWSFWIMDQRYPELFEKIRRYVAEGRIELCGGEWVEPDHLMPDGEALVRQCAYGQWYYQERFGKIASVCWVPDIFGHAGTMPQILKKSGLDGYYFHRCRPKDERGRTLHQFLWEGPDGSRVFALSGEWVYRPDKQVIARAQTELEESGLPAVHVVTGGRSDRRITMLPEWVPDPGQADADPQLPACRWSSADDVLRDMESYAERLPVVRGECGFESTGTYTANGHVKRANRRVETLLMDAEKIASWAWMDGWRYPSEQLAQAWRDLCVNQFHDLICGCSHQDAMLEAMDLFSESERRARWTIERATDFLVRRMKTDGVPGADPLVVFNTLSWPRRGEVVVRRDDAERIEVVRRDGAVVPSQSVRDPDGRPAALFVTDDLSGIASEVYYIWRTNASSPSSTPPGRSYACLTSASGQRCWSRAKRETCCVFITTRGTRRKPG